MPATPPPAVPLRLLYLPNEAKDDAQHRQNGPRRAFAAMQAAGELDAVMVYPFLQRAAQSPAGWGADLLRTAARFRPDVVLWQHPEGCPIPAGLPAALKRMPGEPRLVYHEGDPHGGYLKRMPPPARTLAAAADLMFVVGTGSFPALARRHGARRIAHASQCYDRTRFGRPWQPTTRRRYDLVFIGNRGGTRVPGVMLPGGRRRERLLQALTARFGSRLAVYGRGWDLPTAKGPIPYFEQERVVREAWCSVNWDHFDREPHYSSDRLPIALAAGVPHLTSNHPGYEQLFAGADGLFLADSVDEAVQAATWILSQDRARLLAWGAAAQRFAAAHLEAELVWRATIDVIRRRLFRSTLDTVGPQPRP